MLFNLQSDVNGNFININININIKALWLKQNEKINWNKAKTICEKQDFINFRLSGKMCCSSTNCAARWHWNSEIACETYTDNKNDVQMNSVLSSLAKNGSRKVIKNKENKENKENEENIDINHILKCDNNDNNNNDKDNENDTEYTLDITSGRPVSLLSRIGLSDLLEKWPALCVPMGARVGFLTDGKYARAHTHTCIHTHTHIQYMHTHEHVHKQTYIHTHTTHTNT